MKKKPIRPMRRFLSLLLAAAMFVTAPGISARAKTAGQREPERETLKNPVHSCTKRDDGTDTTDWSYVYFGSYPQTEVAGDALTEAITGAAYDANGDAWVGGIKYRRIQKSDANYTSTSDGYFSWNGDDDYHYFKWERVRWRVMENDGETLFVVADQGLDCKDYNEERVSITWEGCTLREWLNGEFYGTAFSDGEQGAIVERTVVNEDNPYYGTEGGNDTQDRVFLLSIGEATNPSYGFCENYSVYSVSRRMKTSDYAHARGAYNSISSEYAGNCWWWLRSPGSLTNYGLAHRAADVYDDGNVDRSGRYVYSGRGAVVPALHINLSSDLWFLEDDGSSGEGGGSGIGGGGIIDGFTIDESTEAAAGSEVTISGALTLSSQEEASAAVLDSEIAAIAWNSSDSNILDASEIQCVGIHAMDCRSAELLISATPKKEGTVTITGTASNGLTSSCSVTVGKEEEDGETEETEVRHLTGTLQAVDLNAQTVTIDGEAYEVTKTFGISGAYRILNGDGCKTVAAILANDKISRMEAVTDLIEPKVKLSFVPSSISYQGGSFEQESLTVKTTLSCGAKSPYQDSDLKGTEAEGSIVEFSGYTLEAESGLEFRTSLFSKSKEYTDNRSVRLNFGQERTLEQTIYIETGYAPQNVKDTLHVTISAFLGEKTISHAAKLYVANLDRQSEIADSKSSDALVSEAEELLKKVTYSLADYPMEQAGYSKKQKEAVNSAVKTWIADMFITQILTQDTGDNSIWSEFCKEAGFSDSQKKAFLSKVAKKAFQKIGLDISGIADSGSLIQWNDMTASKIIRVYQEDKKTYDTVIVDLNIGSMSFTGSQAFAGTGSLEYSIHTASGKIYQDLNSSPITFADLQQFSAGVEKICKSEIKKIYAMDIAPNLDKGADWIRKQINGFTGIRLVEALTSDTASKILKKHCGSVSDKVYEIYTDELEKCTRGSVHCPVDVYIYDSLGKLCGSIVNDQVDTDTGDVFLYCEGEEKFFRLTGGDYSIRLLGNDEGSMAYTLEEYLGDKLLRTMQYENVPLRKDASYACIVPETQMLDTEVYSLVSDENAELLLPDDDTRQDSLDMENCIHRWNEGEEIKGASCTEYGERKYVCILCGAVKTESLEAFGHQHIELRNQKEPTCQTEGYTGDQWCKDCGVKIKTGQSIAAAGHAYKSIVTKATAAKNGSITEKCAVCGNVKGSRTIAAVKSASVTADSYTYDGKAKEPSVMVTDSNGQAIGSENYTVAYQNNVNVGKAAVTISMKGNYDGALTEHFTICPKGTSLFGKPKASSKGIAIRWKKQPKSTTGYQVQVSASKKFTKKGTVTKTVKKKSVTKLTVRGLKPGKTYYVRVRTYKTVKGKRYCSGWSKMKFVKSRK